jgi:ribosomal protein RSM22 (predicted rRNA methylase)
LSAAPRQGRAAPALLHLEAFLERAHPGFANDEKLHAQARAISEAYTTGSALPAHAAASLAYLAHFGPRAVVAASHALSFAAVPPRCLDVGAGSGASALALFFAGARSVTLLEQSAPALALARRLLEGVGEVRTVPQPIEAAAPVGAELLLSAFTFGELPAAPIDAWTSLARLAPRAQTTVLVDAGDRPRARRLQELRDAIAAGALEPAGPFEGLRVLAPCPHDDPCPALVRARDWCHTRLDKDLPEGLARFARAVGRDDERMAASFLVVGPGARPNPSLLVIGEPLVEKGRVRLPVCGPGGLRFLQALKRNRSAHDALERMDRGARLAATAAQEVRDHTAHIVDETLLLEEP